MRNKKLSNSQKQVLGVLYRAKGWVKTTNETTREGQVNVASAWALEDMGLIGSRYSEKHGDQVRLFASTRDLMDLARTYKGDSQ